MNHQARQKSSGAPTMLPPASITTQANKTGHCSLAASISLRWVVSCGDVGLVTDYLRFLHSSSELCNTQMATESLTPELLLHKLNTDTIRPAQIVVFIDRRVTAQLAKLIAALSQLASMVSYSCIVVLPSLLRHLSPRREVALQALLDQLSNSFHIPRNRLTPSVIASASFSRFPGSADNSDAEILPRPSRLIILRTGFVLSPSSSIARKLRRLSRFRVLVSPRLTTTFVTGEQLFSTITAELERPEPLSRTVRSETTPAAKTTMDDVLNPRGTIITDVLHHSHLPFPSESSDAPARSAALNTRQLTVLGARRSWTIAISDQLPAKTKGLSEQLTSLLLTWLGIPWLFYLCLRILIAVIPSLRQVHFHTLKPVSVTEILSLYNRYNCRFVKLAGYNNGVNHFGWTFPGKTVVLTTGLPGKMHLSDSPCSAPDPQSTSTMLHGECETHTANTSLTSGTHFTVDAGLTLKQCIQELNTRDREFYVVPNYSWISMGTLYFVPVHGSGSKISTLGDTIEEVLLFDGDTEEFNFTRRGDRLFRETMYDTQRNILLLRLTLKVKQKSTYIVKAETRTNPSAEDILKVFDDPHASNVEIRKNHAAGPTVDIRRYYVDSPTIPTGGLAMPRDSIGRVWDRLEETPVVSTLFHWFVRRFAFHVELILRPEEFVIFWQHHRQLPVSKIQLRQMLRDDITNSACATQNCISADLFMTRGNRDAFMEFINSHIPHARFNPGKQSACPGQFGM